MKNSLFVLIFAVLAFAACTKQADIVFKSDYSPVAARSAFQTYIDMGEDLIVPKTDSICLTGYSAYLSTCGTAPETEAPQMGVRVWQISGPAVAGIGWYQGKPTFTSLRPGTYSFVGSAWVLGYRSCDDSTMNDEVYDTVNVTILKRKSRGK
jgi:hypothetical protein